MRHRCLPIWTITPFLLLQADKDSNPDPWTWKPRCCRYTIDLIGDLNWAEPTRIELASTYADNVPASPDAYGSIVGMARFELAVSWSQTTRIGQAMLHPVTQIGGGERRREAKERPRRRGSRVLRAGIEPPCLRARSEGGSLRLPCRGGSPGNRTPLSGSSDRRNHQTCSRPA